MLLASRHGVGQLMEPLMFTAYNSSSRFFQAFDAVTHCVMIAAAAMMVLTSVTGFWA
jgi:hypothetical protein